ncbi:hypothetical protein [Streptomyces sp. KLOTTS4A1]|uniref:hypothetical protein n=1 Tax=Streptomyces sp. KLOTTS4A1 TaxID=3390996 RepID=UPI0039F54F21
MSHHLDTPLAAKSGQLFIDDLYVFRGERGSVFVLNVNSNITGVDQEPGFHAEARYEFKVHFGGADIEPLTYRISFGEADGNGVQAMRLHVLTGVEAREDGAEGHFVLEGRTGETAQIGGTRLWAGRVKDPFYMDLTLPAKINGAIGQGTAVDLSDWQPAKAGNTFAGTSVETIVLEVPDEGAVLTSGAEAGVWCATKLATDAGGRRQNNRGGHPTMWPIFWPKDTDFSNPANTRHPSRDLAEDGDHIAGRIAAVAKATGTSADLGGYGQIVSGRLFPDILPYVVGSAAAYGFARGNVRPLADNAPESMLFLVTGMAVPAGLKPSVALSPRTCAAASSPISYPPDTRPVPAFRASTSRRQAETPRTGCARTPHRFVPRRECRVSALLR